MEMDCILKNSASIFQSSAYPSLRQNKICTMDNSSCKKLIDLLALNFKAMFSMLVKQ